MNRDRIEGKWNQIKGALKINWGRLTRNNLCIIDGKEDQKLGKLQETYGIAKEESANQIHEFIKLMKSAK